MALLHVDFFSDVLGMCTSADVILPQQTSGQIGMEGKGAEGKLKTMYLLHGMSAIRQSGSAEPLSSVM